MFAIDTGIVGAVAVAPTPTMNVPISTSEEEAPVATVM
jgi:hypothetical protein